MNELASHLNRMFLIPFLTAGMVFIGANVLLYFLIFGMPPPTIDSAPPSAIPVVSAVQPPTPIPQLSAEVATISNWIRSDNVVTQATNLGQDMVYGTGVISERFDVSVVIDLPDDVADSGGGIVFHMQGRDDYANAPMVRLADGGRTVMWGHFDENRQFIGESGVTIAPSQAPVTLSLHVGNGTFDVMINNTQVAAGLPLRTTAGYLGYISYRGPVSFSNFTLALSS